MDAVKSIETENDGKTFEVPESRIGNAADARSIISDLKKAEKTRSERRARINGNLNGNRPWPSLVGKGQGERANFNQREGEGFVAAAKTPYYDLVFEVDRFAQFTIDYGDDPTRLNEWADKIGTRYHYALDDWDAMDAWFQRSQYQMVVHGVGPMTWENARDWHSKSCMAGQFLVPDDASAEIDEWETAAKPRPYTPSDLWKKIRREDVAKNWNIPAVKRAIMQAAPETVQSNFGSNWEYYEAEIRKGAAGWNNKSKKIFVSDLFQKEFNGKISHFIVLDTSIETASEWDDSDEKNPQKGFLYRKIGRFESFAQIIDPFLYDVGPDGQWHSVKGAGPKILDFCSISDRLTCKMVDGANASSGLIVQAKNATALQQTAITHINGGVCLNPDYEIHQNKFADNLQSPLLVKRDLKSTLSKNTGQYEGRANQEIPFPTLGQEQMNASQEAMLGKGEVNRYYRSLDKWHKETFRRLLLMGESLYKTRKDRAPDDIEKEKSLTSSECGALKFYRGCITDGVPEEVLQFENFCRIKATRTVGNGSAQMRLVISNELTQMLPMMDERGRNTALRMKASALAGQNVADQLFPRYDIPQIVDSHQSLAQLENNFLRMPGGKVLIDASQNHAVHLQSHIADVAAHADEVKQGGDPAALMVHLEQAGPHLHEHLFAIQGDPTRKAEVQEMMKAWMAMSEMADQLKQQLEEAARAQEAQQPSQAPDPELIAKLAKVHGDLGIKREKVMGDLAIKAEKQRADLKRKDLQAAHGMRLKAFQAQPETAAA